MVKQDVALPTTEKFGDLLREARDRKGLSLREVGEAVGIHYANLSKVETAQRRPPARDKVIVMARVLGLDVNRLLVAAGYPVDLRYFHAHLAAEDKVASLDVRQVGPSLSQGLELARHGQYERALQVFGQLQQIGDLWEIYAALGTTFYRMGRYKDAELHLKMAIARVPSRPLPPWPDGEPPRSPDPWPQPRLYYDLALVYTDTGRLRLAESCVRRALELGTSYRDLYRSQLGKIYTYQGRYEDVLRVAEEVLGERRRTAQAALATALAAGRESAPPPEYSLGYFDVCTLAAYAHARLGRHEAARALLDGALALYDRYWYSHYVSAVVACVQAEARFRAWRRDRRGELLPPLQELLHRARADLQLALKLYPDFRPLAARDPDLRLLRKRAFRDIRRWPGYHDERPRP